MKIRGVVENLPEEIKVDISKLKIGESIKVKAVKADNVEFLDIPNSVVVMVKTARGGGGALEDEEGEEGVTEGEEAAE